jgi:nitroimidazol reductase NimA-like FMN-containing flavoprotein (pyridoxamine 5'-phosphate oxidase superfamily)
LLLVLREAIYDGMSAYSPTARTTLHRRPIRGTYDRATVHAILDEALVCQLGFVVDRQPFVLPTTFVRDCERVIVHGAGAGRMMRTLADGVPACLGVTLIDGLVLARSAFRHTMNYRSVLVLGTAHEVTDCDEKLRVMALLIDKISPGRAKLARAPNDKEIRATTVLSLPLEEVSAKIRVGPPVVDDEDAGQPVWAGVVPLALRAGTLQPDCGRDDRFDPPALPPGVGAEKDRR